MENLYFTHQETNLWLESQQRLESGFINVERAEYGLRSAKLSGIGLTD